MKPTLTDIETKKCPVCGTVNSLCRMVDGDGVPHEYCHGCNHNQIGWSDHTTSEAELPPGYGKPPEFTKPFSAGDPRDPRPDDIEFAAQEEAAAWASECHDDNTIRCVWNNDTGEILAMYFRGVEYTP